MHFLHQSGRGQAVSGDSSQENQLRLLQCPDTYRWVSGNPGPLDREMVIGKQHRNRAPGNQIDLSDGEDQVTDNPMGAYGSFLTAVLQCESTLKPGGNCSVPAIDSELVRAVGPVVGFRTKFKTYPPMFIEGVNRNYPENNYFAFAMALVLWSQGKLDEAKTFIDKYKTIESEGGWDGANEPGQRAAVRWLEATIKSKASSIVSADDIYEKIVLNPKKYSGTKVLFSNITIIRIYPPDELDQTENAYILAALGTPQDERVQRAFETQVRLVKNFGFQPDLRPIRSAQNTDDKLLLVRVGPKEIEKIENLKARSQTGLVGVLTGNKKLRPSGQVVPGVDLAHLINP